MSLTMGNGPFAKPLAGTLNFDLAGAAPASVIYLYGLDRRIRGEFAGEIIVDTVRATMVHETRLLPQWYLPLADVRPGVLIESDSRTHCPYKGDARYWHLSLNGRTVRDAAWSYPEPLSDSPDLRGLVAFYQERMDAWFEEDERLVGHPRDPFHRVDTRRSSRRVIVRIDGEVVGDSRNAVALYETGLPVRWYLPADDVAVDLLTPSDATSRCPYKGASVYYHLKGTPEGIDNIEDIAWSIPEPLPEAGAVAGHLSFDGHSVSVTVQD